MYNSVSVDLVFEKLLLVPENLRRFFLKYGHPITRYIIPLNYLICSIFLNVTWSGSHLTTTVGFPSDLRVRNKIEKKLVHNSRRLQVRHTICEYFYTIE